MPDSLKFLYVSDADNATPRLLLCPLTYENLALMLFTREYVPPTTAHLLPRLRLKCSVPNGQPIGFAGACRRKSATCDAIAAGPNGIASTVPLEPVTRWRVKLRAVIAPQPNAATSRFTIPPDSTPPR